MEERKYRVRRLTPLECTRLQGLPDYWTVPDHKKSMTEDEVTFWNEVRGTKAAIDGKSVKPMDERAALKWYNRLRSDSAEYRMLGNGIALPNATFIMERIAMDLKKGA